MPIGFQLKATWQDVVRDKFVHFEIDRDLYNTLRIKDDLWRFLVVLPLPSSGDWVSHGKDCLEIHRSMYWFSLMGAKSLPPKAKTMTCKIPRSQIVTADWLVSVFRDYVESD